MLDYQSLTDDSLAAIIPAMKNDFADYDALIAAALAADEANPTDVAFYASITHAISEEAVQVSRGRSKGRYVAKNVEKAEQEVRERFVKLVNQYRDGGVSFNGVADLILGLSQLDTVAWAVAQRLPR